MGEGTLTPRLAAAVLRAVCAEQRSSHSDSSREQFSPPLEVGRTIKALDAHIGASLKTPPPRALVLTAEHLRLELERAKRAVRAEERRLALLKKRADALVTELTLLRQVKTEIDQRKSGDCPRSASITRDFDEHRKQDRDACRLRIARILLLYADSWTIGRLPQAEARYLIIDVRHQASIDASEVALLEWQNLIQVPLGQLVAFHGSGIRSEDIGRLLQALGLGAIAGSR